MKISSFTRLTNAILISLTVLLGNTFHEFFVPKVPESSKIIESKAYFVDATVPDLDLSKVIVSDSVFHLFSHARPGELFIHSRWMNPEDISSWLQENRMLNGHTHLNIYGCNFAKGDKGRTAVAFLEKDLGISIAASDDLTGKGGDWELEVGKEVQVLRLTTYAANLQIIYQQNFEEFSYETWLGKGITGGSDYYNSPNPPTGGRNGLTNGIWEYNNTTIGQSANGKFLMFWTDDQGPNILSSQHKFFGVNVFVEPNTTYQISYRLGALTEFNPPVVRLYANSTLIKTSYTVSSNWRTFNVQWNSEASSILVLEFLNDITLLFGNDLALDDITITAIPPFPVEYISFDAKIMNDQAVQLEWLTAIENNNDYFIIERSTDASTWERFGLVEGAGNSNHRKSYKYTDKTPLPGYSYYRLKQYDFNGQSSVSNTRSVFLEELNQGINTHIFPNPAKDVLSISGDFIPNPGMKIYIMTPFGQELWREDYNAGNQNTEQYARSIDIRSWAQGIYYLVIVDDNVVNSTTFEVR